MNLIDGLRLGARWAGQPGVRPGLENLDAPFVSNLSIVLEIIREIDLSWLYQYPDIGNLSAAGYYLPVEIILAQNEIMDVHVKDAIRRLQNAYI